MEIKAFVHYLFAVPNALSSLLKPADQAFIALYSVSR
jgi:hypothetical protein